MGKTYALAAAALAASLAFAATAAEPLPKLDWKLTPFAAIEGGTLTVAVPAESAHASASATAPFDLAPYAGRRLVATVRCRGKGITKPRESWNGLKFQFHYRDAASGDDCYPNTASLLGDFDEREISVTVDLAGAKPGKATLTLGLQDSAGTAAFDLSTLRFRAEGPLCPATNAAWRVSYPPYVLNRGQLRGVMLPGGPCKEEEFKTLHEWGATLARYQMTRNWGRHGTDQDLEEYDRWLDSKLGHLEQVLAWARKYGISIVVDLHQPPGGRGENNEMAMFYEKRFADHFVEAWKRIATRFTARPEIYGFDLINEPLQESPAPFNFWDLQRRAAEAIRAIDPATTIIIECNCWDSSRGYRTLSPLAMDNVIYQVHLYDPGQFTHQGVHAPGREAEQRAAWPDDRRGWNREFLRRTLAPVREFQQKHNARIYAGEFSAINWAPGADIYIGDCIALFDEYGWDWTFHAFREWPGWSVEHVGESAATLRPSADNPRKRALLNGLRPRGAK